MAEQYDALPDDCGVHPCGPGERSGSGRLPPDRSRAGAMRGRKPVRGVYVDGLASPASYGYEPVAQSTWTTGPHAAEDLGL